eukprot:SAG25_NODE_108_length_15257_cov_63.784404_5_plen_67_part_00
MDLQTSFMADVISAVETVRLKVVEQGGSREGGRKLKCESHGGARKRTELAIAAAASAASESESSSE